MSAQLSTPAIEQIAGKGAARAARRRQARLEGGVRRPGWGTYLLLTLVLLVSFVPIYYAFLLASSTSSEIAQHPIPSPIPGSHLLENLQRVLHSDIKIWQAFQNSMIVSVVTALSVMFFSTLAGFAFAKLRFRGKRFLLAFVIGTMAIPSQLGIIPLFIVMAKLGWTGKLAAVIVPAMVSAFGVFWMAQYLEDALPYELIEAARMDGCNMIRTFWHVVVPAARPAASMLGLFTFVGSWTSFFWPFIVLGSSNPTLPVALQLLQASYFKDMALIMAGVLIITLPLVLVFLVAGRQLVAGVMQGAVKG